MGIQRIDTTGIIVSMLPNGNACLTMSSGTGTFEVYVPGEVWTKLGKSAQWFDRNCDQQELIHRLSTERENALTRERELGSQLRAMTEARNELAMKIDQLEQEEEIVDEESVEDDRHAPTTVVSE